MNETQILKDLNVIFKKVFDNEDLIITATTTASEVEEWDSLSYIHLIVAIEKHFKIKFMAAEIQYFKHVGDMIVAISAKKASS